MHTSRRVGIPWAALTWCCLCLAATPVHAERPTREELALRDQWVAEHFAAPEAGDATREGPTPGLTVWTNYDSAYLDAAGPRPLSIAGRVFEHGLYVHAPSRVQVHLPAPAETFHAVLGIQDSGSHGGSVVFSVERDGERVYASPVMHRGEAGLAAQVALGGAQSLFLCASSAGDGIASDQAAWGDARVTLADGRELRLSELPLRYPDDLPRAAARPPFSFHFGGRPSDELLPGWRLEEERTVQPGRTTHVQAYRDPESGLVVRCTAVVYADFPTVEWTLDFENTGEHDTPLLAGILPLDARLDGSAEGGFLLHHFTGSPCTPSDYQPLETALGPGTRKRITTQGGRPTNSDLPYFNLEAGDGGVIAVVSWAGQWAAQFTHDAQRGLRLTAGQEATAFVLRPGERVRSPLAVLQFYRGDWLRAQNVWRAWMLAHSTPRRRGEPLAPFLYVCNGGYYPGLMTDAATELAFLRRYLEEGIHPDYWNQDAGWYPCAPGGWPRVGTWEVDRTRWPHGLREASDWLAARRIGTITWFEPERVHPGTWLALNHPEWSYGGSGSGLVNLGDPACRAWITDRVDRVITEEGIDFYRQDFNIDPLYWWRGHDADDRQGIAEIRHVEGYFAFWDELVRRHPDLWIDTCASGGRRNDLETLRRAVPILRSDWVVDPSGTMGAPRDQQNHMYGISHWMPYNGTGYMTIDEYLARSVMTTIHGIGVDTRIRDLDYDLLRRLQREWRQISPCYLGDYWPLTPYARGEDAWVAWQFDRPETGEGVVQAFRRQDCAAESITVKLRGLDPSAVYEVTNVDEREPRRIAGRELTERGLTLSATQRPAALIHTYQRLERMEPDPRRVQVKPVFLVPTDASGPSEEQVALILEHLEWSQARYRDLLDGRDTFALAPGSPLVLTGTLDRAGYAATTDGGAEAAVLQLLAHDGLDRLSCPYVYVVLFVDTGPWPGGGGRPLNGGVNTGGGIVILSADALIDAPNFQSTLQHELGHAFGLPHVDVYGLDMLQDPSLMSYNPGHHTRGLRASPTPGGLIPEDRRALDLAERLFPGFELDPGRDPPPGYSLAPMVLLGPMALSGQPDYDGPSIGE